MTGWMVLGTDTGVGKSRLACALLYGLRQRGYRALGMKPVATGLADDGGENPDVAILAAASSAGLKDGRPVPRDWVNPYAFVPPIAPHLAAHKMGVTIDFARLQESCRALQSGCDRVVVEGAGGVLVPLGADGDMADLALCLGLPVILVVGLKLGCLNHALLSAEALQRRGVRWAGWVGNRLQADLEEEEGQLDTLRQRLPAPYLGVYPHGVPAHQGYPSLDWHILLGQAK